MATTRRTLLLVEDDVALNEVYTTFCQIALQELYAEGLPVDGVVEQAFDYSRAGKVLESRPVDFVSIDIALSEQEVGLTEEKRLEREPGGMKLLRELQRVERQPLAVVVTGQTLQSYASDALQKYGVLAFYQKARFDSDKYKNAIKAVLWYLDALDLITEPETELDITAALESWKKALGAADMAGIKGRPFPESVGYQIEAKRDELTHSVTGLPIGHWTQEKLRDKIVGHQDWALVRVTIKGFGRFVATFPSQEEPILSLVAGLLKRARDEFQDQGLFIGHLGYLEHTLEPTFVLIFGEGGARHVADSAHWIETEFQKTGSELFMPALESIAGQHGLALSVEARAMTGAEHTFPDLHLLLDTLGSSQL